MERGEIWAYKETPKKEPVAVRVVSIGTNAGVQKVKIEFVEDRFEGLQRWVTLRKLPVLWDEVEAWVEQERLVDTVHSCRRPVGSEELTLGMAMTGMPEHVAAYHYKTGTISDPDEFERITGVSAGEITAGLPCFHDERGVNFPIEGVIRMAKAVARARPAAVLRWVDEKEEEELYRCSFGYDFEDPVERGVMLRMTAERCREYYREDTEPMLAQLRDWCGHKPDGVPRETPEVSMQRRLDETVSVAERAIAILRRHDRKHDADALSQRLREALGVERLSNRKGRGKGWYERD